MKHPTPQQMTSYLDNEGRACWQHEIDIHLKDCPVCRATLAQMRAMRQAMWATRSTLPGMCDASSFMEALRRRIRSGQPSGWHSICFAAPTMLALAGMGAHTAAWVILGGDLMQHIGIVPRVGPKVSAWAVETATAPIWQRIVYAPLGLSEQEAASMVSAMVSPIENEMLRPMWAMLIMAMPLALLFGVSIMALSWFVCWTGPSQRK